MAKKVDLDTLIGFVGKHWPFNEQNYPGFSRLSLREQKKFIVKHGLLHINKSVGKIAAECEEADHGEELDEGKVEFAIAKVLVNLSKLCDELKIPAERLERHADIIVRTG